MRQPDLGRRIVFTKTIAVALFGWVAFLAFGSPSAKADMDCRHFQSQQEAQDYFESIGGSRTYNADLLDEDRDGLACEALPGFVVRNTFENRRVDDVVTSRASDSTPLQVQASQDGAGSRSGWWYVAGAVAVGVAIYYYLELYGEKNRRVTLKPSSPYNTKTMPYPDYLRTSEWAEIREMAFKRDGHKCIDCGSSHRLQAHHRSYSRRGHEKLKDLQTLCASCHEQKHCGSKPRR